MIYCFFINISPLFKIFFLSFFTGITNNQGVASVTVTGITAETTFTASYSNVSDTCTVTAMTYYINDPATSDNSSTLFGSSYDLRGGGSNSVSWNSNGYYTITNTASQRESFRQLTALNGITGDFVLEYDSYIQGTSGSSGMVIYKDSNNWCKLTDDGNKKYWWGKKVNGTFTESAAYPSQNTYQAWFHHKFTISNGSFSVVITDSNNNQVYTRTETIPSGQITSSTLYGIDSEWNNNTVTRYKNIQAYPI